MPTATDRNSKKPAATAFFSSSQKQTLRRKLLAWYARHARKLPWRESRDPYRVWISEIMLQQTQVATVRDYFARFVNAMPTVQHLATADEQDVLRLWEGLGYYRRARQLHSAARKIVAERGGEFPRTVDKLRELPGIGRYTAGAIASIAFDQRAPILEANTVRLLSRLIAYRDDPLATAGQHVLWQMAEEILPQRRSAEFNQALMELGSLVCTPSEPRCGECPLSTLCAARAAGAEHEIPMPKARKVYTEVREAAVIVRKKSRVLIRQCGPKERWAGLWDFPRFAVEAEGPLFAAEEIVRKLQEQTGVHCGSPTLLHTMRYGVTRYRISLDCFQAEYLRDGTKAVANSTVRWITARELSALPLSTTGRRIARARLSIAARWLRALLRIAANLDHPPHLSADQFPYMSTSLVDSPGTFRPMLRLTLPVLVEQMLHLLVGLTDMWLTGNFLPGEAYVAAMTLMIYALWLVGNVFGFVALGSTAPVARFVGAGDRELANRVVNQSMTSGLIWSAALVAFAIPLARYFPLVMGLNGLAAAAAHQYLVIELCVLPAVMVERVAVACLRGAGDMVSGLVVMAIVNVINMVVSYSLCSGLGPLPAMGWTGIAVGTAIGHCCGAAILITLLAGGRAGFYLRLSEMQPDFAMIRRILRIGVPGGIDVILVSICHLVYLRIVLSLGDVAAAAHGVAIQVEALGYMPGGAFQISAATLAGQYLGAKDLVRARSSVIMACALATGIMVVAGAVFYVAAEPLASFFLGGRQMEVVPLAAHLLRIVAFAMAPLAILMVLIGALRGAGDTRWPLALNLLGVICVRVPLAYVLAHSVICVPFVGPIAGAGLGVVGAWYGAVVDIVVRCVLLIARFRHDAWQRIDV